MSSYASSYASAIAGTNSRTFNIANTSTDPGTVLVTDSCTYTCTFASSHSTYRCTDCYSISSTNSGLVL